MVFGNWDDIFGASFFEELRPRCWIEVFGLEQWNKVFVSKLILSAVRGQVMFVFVGTLAIHVARVPLATECGYGIDAPVNEDAELRVLIPFGDLIFLQRFPVGTERAVVTLAIYFLEEGCARIIVFRTGFLPGLVNLFWILRGRWSVRRSCGLRMSRHRNGSEESANTQRCERPKPRTRR